jgi:AAA domain
MLPAHNEMARKAFEKLGFVDHGTAPANDGDPGATEYPDSADGERDVEAEAAAAAKVQRPHAAPHFVPIPIDDVVVSDAPAWLIDGLLPARGLACIVGPPKSGKSFLTSDMLFSVARGVPYASRETMQGPVVYLTGEGVNGFKRRLIAMRRHHSAEGQGVPFYMVESVPDLGSEQTSLPQLVADLDAFIAQRVPGGVRAIVLDTLARCMGEADENSARDMGRFVNRCSAIERHFECLVVVVHHVGKDPTRGGRGSNSLNGAADVTMIVEKTDAFSTVRVDEMKDGPEGQEWRFRLVPYALSETSDTPSETSPEVSACVVELLSEPSAAKPRETKKVKAPRGVTGDLLKVIRRASEEAGERNVESLAVPNNVRVISKANLKRYCTTMDWQDPGGKPDSFRTMLNKNLSALRSADLIGFDRDWVWLI